MRRRVLLADEAAEREPDEIRRRRLLTFVLVGGGPTGVELAGALTDIARQSLKQDFRNIQPESARIVPVPKTSMSLHDVDESERRGWRSARRLSSLTTSEATITFCRNMP